MADIPQVASANSEADSRIKESYGNGPLYIVTAEDITAKLKYRKFYCVKLTTTFSNYVNIIGFEAVNSKDEETFALNSLKEVSEYVHKNKIKLEDYSIPWTKIINIKTKTVKKA